jgi:hypothetical protein
MINVQFDPSPAGARATQAKSDDCRARAARCQELAKKANNATLTRVFEDVARAWLRLAEQCDSM